MQAGIGAIIKKLIRTFMYRYLIEASIKEGGEGVVKWIVEEQFSLPSFSHDQTHPASESSYTNLTIKTSHW